VISAAGFPLVVAKTKTTNVNLLGVPIGKKDTLTIDVTKQGISDIRHIVMALVNDETENQVRLDNKPTAVVVDGNEHKSLKVVRKNVQVFFGNLIDQVMIKAIEKEVKLAIQAQAPSWYKKAELYDWGWFFAKDKKKAAVPVTKGEMSKLSMNRGSLLVYMPTSVHVALANMFAARIDAGWRGYQLWQKGRSGGKGFMAKGINRLKRTRVTKQYVIMIQHTQRFQLPGQDKVYRHGTPCVVVYAARKIGSYRK